MQLDMNDKANREWAAFVTEQLALFVNNPATAIYRGENFTSTAKDFVSEQFGPDFRRVLETRTRQPRTRRASSSPAP
jgi:hypothetical protein